MGVRGYLVAVAGVLLVATPGCRDSNHSANLKATEAKVVAALPDDLHLVTADPEPDGYPHRTLVYESERPPDVLFKELRTRFAAAKLRPFPVPPSGYQLNEGRYYTTAHVEPNGSGSSLKIFTYIEG